MKTAKRIMLAGFLAALLATATPAFAFNESGTVDPLCVVCADCHDGDYSSGPHRGYLTTTRRCGTCHSMHNAPGTSIRLLPGTTITDSCEVCHDGTGGQGVYGALAARGLTVISRHRTEATRVVPGGDVGSGGSSVATFTGLNYTLSCDDCHSPHGANTVASFTGDRVRTASDTVYVSDRLLKKRPTSSNMTVAVYGSDWCGGCHQGRTSQTQIIHNHPVDTLNVTATPYYYNYVPVLTTDTNPTQTAMGPLGRTNRGYLMIWPRTPQQSGHNPICMQCHEDPRQVGTSLTIDPFQVTTLTPNGVVSTDNPRFQVFPHEATTTRMLLQTGEDLCTNCHPNGSSMW
ncbi:MAG: hypothetical protein WC971_09100 [Coriobacteriia bacterium]